MTDDFMKTKLKEWRGVADLLHADISETLDGRAPLTRAKITEWLESSVLLGLNISVALKRLYVEKPPPVPPVKKLRRRVTK